MDKSKQLKASVALKERALAFTKEGYFVRSMYDTPSLFFATLRHQTNGNEITLIGYPLSNYYCQKMNGRYVIPHATIL